MSMAVQCDKCGRICRKSVYKVTVNPSKIAYKSHYDEMSGYHINFDLCEECYEQLTLWVGEDNGYAE